MNGRTILLIAGLCVTASFAGFNGRQFWQERRGSDPTPVVVAAAVDTRIIALGKSLLRSDVVAIPAPSRQDVGRSVEIGITEGDNRKKGAFVAVFETLSSRAAQHMQQAVVGKQHEAALEKVCADRKASAAQLQATLR